MRKYIITPVLLAIVCMVMCRCTSNRKASVAANEYLIQGELANLPDSIVIGLYEEDGNILNCVPAFRFHAGAGYQRYQGYYYAQ